MRLWTLTGAFWGNFWKTILSGWQWSPIKTWNPIKSGVCSNKLRNQNVGMSEYDPVIVVKRLRTWSTILYIMLYIRSWFSDGRHTGRRMRTSPGCYTSQNNASHQGSLTFRSVCPSARESVRRRWTCQSWCCGDLNRRGSRTSIIFRICWLDQGMVIATWSDASKRIFYLDTSGPSSLLCYICARFWIVIVLYPC